MAVQRCTVHKLRNLERKAPTHALEEIKGDYNRIVYADTLAQARTARDAFIRKSKKNCPGVVASLQEDRRHHRRHHRRHRRGARRPRGGPPLGVAPRDSHRLNCVFPRHRRVVAPFQRGLA